MKTFVVVANVKDAPATVSATVDILDSLIKDEDEAIAAYKAAIEALPQFKEQLTHILEEEIEHKQELLMLKA